MQAFSPVGYGAEGEEVNCRRRKERAEDGGRN